MYSEEGIVVGGNPCPVYGEAHPGLAAGRWGAEGLRWHELLCALSTKLHRGSLFMNPNPVESYVINRGEIIINKIIEHFDCCPIWEL